MSWKGCFQLMSFQKIHELSKPPDFRFLGGTVFTLGVLGRDLGCFLKAKKLVFPLSVTILSARARAQELQNPVFWDVVSKRSVPDFRKIEGKYDAWVLALRSLGSSLSELSMETSPPLAAV